MQYCRDVDGVGRRKNGILVLIPELLKTRPGFPPSRVSTVAATLNPSMNRAWDTGAVQRVIAKQEAGNQLFKSRCPICACSSRLRL